MLYVARTFLFCLATPATDRPTAFLCAKIRNFDGKTISAPYYLQNGLMVVSNLTRTDFFAFVIKPYDKFSVLVRLGTTISHFCR